MCTNMRYIYNKYINKSVYVPCGKCESCLQQKATYRANRIRNNVAIGTLPLFITLTYKPDSIPYVLREDLLLKKLDVPVYRDSSYRVVRRNGQYDMFEKRSSGTRQIDSLYISNEFYNDSHSCSAIVSTPHPRGSRKGVIGIAYYKDIQNFEKRLKQKLKRNYGLNDSFSYYQCSEYGETTFRPHFHLLIFAPESKVDAYKSAIIESWPFADRNRTAEYIEVARNAASYVASYVNKSNDFPLLFKTHAFREKHSYSQGFGKALHCFSLSNILQKVDGGTLTYNALQIKDGIPCFVSYVIPEYVVNRYFPKFKGYSRLTSDSLAVVLQSPQRLRHFGWLEPYTDDDIKKMSVSTRNAYKRYFDETGKSFFDYIIDYIRVWNCHKSTIYRQFMMKNDEENTWYEAYDNMYELIAGSVCSLNLMNYFRNQDIKINELQLNPNKYLDRVLQTERLRSVFHKTVKQRKVVNLVMDRIGCYT